MNTKELKELRKTLIEAHIQGALDMSSWAWRGYNNINKIDLEPGTCGSTLCAAGWTVMRAGWRILWETRGPSASYCSKDGETKGIEGTAAEFLGMTYLESQALFYADGPEDGQDIEQSEVIRVLDALILWSERKPDSNELELLGDEFKIRDYLIDWYDVQPTAV